MKGTSTVLTTLPPPTVTYLLGWTPGGRQQVPPTPLSRGPSPLHAKLWEAVVESSTTGRVAGGYVLEAAEDGPEVVGTPVPQTGPVDTQVHSRLRPSQKPILTLTPDLTPDPTLHPYQSFTPDRLVDRVTPGPSPALRGHPPSSWN